MDVQGKTFVTRTEAQQALTKLPDSQKHHVETRRDAAGHETYTIVDNAPAVAKKGKAAATLAMTASRDPDRVPLTGVKGTLGQAGRALSDSVNVAAKAVGAAGKAKPGWFKPEYLGPIGILPGPIVLTPAVRDRITQALKDFGEVAGPALRPLPPPTLSPAAKERIAKELREASKNLGPISALPGFHEKAHELTAKAKDAATEVAKTVGKAIVFGPFLPGVLLSEASATRR